MSGLRKRMFRYDTSSTIALYTLGSVLSAGVFKIRQNTLTRSAWIFERGTHFCPSEFFFDLLV
jgi:hypothetical protein